MNLRGMRKEATSCTQTGMYALNYSLLFHTDHKNKESKMFGVNVTERKNRKTNKNSIYYPLCH